GLLLLGHRVDGGVGVAVEVAHQTGTSSEVAASSAAFRSFVPCRDGGKLPRSMPPNTPSVAPICRAIRRHCWTTGQTEHKDSATSARAARASVCGLPVGNMISGS